MSMVINGELVRLERESPGHWRATIGAFGLVSVHGQTAFEVIRRACELLSHDAAHRAA